ncbi:cupin domain-containing protein [Micromonospora sp. KC606]|uniref:1,2-dihydroxy-3-keto-5-methylthiopentene dioxygenase n=1 Tax=Micromonospora sp. KC606 TaxID=2530379 RepID=UPI00104D026C|nr:cupin domain-containing protein [Micromonospora sp. KC606]TDC82865.1 cupin domain-containing protein [Micromonospora sp. KC606]
MTLLQIMPDDDSRTVVARTDRPDEISAALSPLNVQFEQWERGRQLASDASSDDVLAAYQQEIDRLCAQGEFRLVDVVRIKPDEADPQWPARAHAARARFLEEHTHDEDEVRFFVEGSGCFYLHVGRKVYAVVCEAGDLLWVPRGTPHWFDMGSRPDLTAIRFFQEEDGWIGNFLPDSLAKAFPTVDDLRAVQLP